MPKFKYVGPHDEVELIGAGVVKRDEVIDVPPGIDLTGRSDFELVDLGSLSLDELLALAAARGIEVPEGAKKPDVITILKES